jgi:putative hydrolase of the HAD superfamily
VQSRERVEVDLLVPMPGVLDWLDEARDADVPVGVASSSSRSWVEGRLAQLGILDLFAVVACRDEHLRAKPAPDVYLAACRELRGDPTRSVAIEDSRNGVSSALAAGLTCIAVPNEITADMDLSGAHYLMRSLNEASLTHVLEVISERRRMLDNPERLVMRPRGHPNR